MDEKQKKRIEREQRKEVQEEAKRLKKIHKEGKGTGAQKK